MSDWTDEGFIDMGVWLCSAKFVDPYSTRLEGSKVYLKIQGRQRMRDLKTPEKAESFLARANGIVRAAHAKEDER